MHKWQPCKAVRRLSHIIHATSLFVFLCATAHAQQWLSIGHFGENEEFIDIDSIRMEGGLLRFWSKTVYAKPKQYPADRAVFQVAITSYAVNCLTRALGVTASSSYTLQGDLVKTFDYEPDRKSVV